MIDTHGEPCIVMPMTDTFPTLIALPNMCGPAGNLARGGDMNTEWTCLRAHRIYSLHVWAGHLERSMTRVSAPLQAPRHADDAAYAAYMSRRATRRRRIREVVGRIEWFNRDTAQSLSELAPCTHAPEDQREMSVEDSLPTCSY